MVDILDWLRDRQHAGREFGRDVAGGVLPWLTRIVGQDSRMTWGELADPRKNTWEDARPPFMGSSSSSSSTGPLGPMGPQFPSRGGGSRPRSRQSLPTPPRVRAPRVAFASMPAPPRPTLPDFSAITEALAASQQSTVDALAGLESQYQEQLGALRQQYALSETPREKAAIQAALRDLNAQRKAGHQVIQKSYGQAIKGSKRSAKQTRKSGDRAAKRTSKTFSKAAEQAKRLVKESQADFADASMGLGSGGLSGEAKEIAKELVKQGARQAAFTRNQDRAAANEIQYLGESMRGERSAQQGELQRVVTGLRSEAQQQHDAQVAARINAERQALAQAQQALSSMFTQRGYGLQDQLSQIGLQGAGIQADLASQSAGIFNDWRNQVWQTQVGNQQAAVDARNARSQQQFEMDSARQAAMYQQRLEEIQRRREAVRQRRQTEAFLSRIGGGRIPV